MVWETSYVGNKATSLWGQYEGNQPLTNGPGSPTTRRPLAKYTVASIKAFTPWNHSTFEGMSSHLDKRFSKGVSLQASFTYGRALDLQNAALDACDGCGSGNTVQNVYNREVQKGPSENNVPVRFVFAGVWQLPFGGGHALAGHGWAAQVVGGWEVSAIYSAQSGLPFTTNLSFDNANAGTTSWPDRVCDGNISNHSLQRWFDTGCFVAPASYVFGNEGRNVLTGPGRNNLDIGIHRSFRIPGREGMRLSVRGEGFNFFNHPQFGLPGSTIGNPGVGTITGTAVANRIVQLALRFAF
jgi:hypothetical protein